MSAHYRFKLQTHHMRYELPVSATLQNKTMNPNSSRSMIHDQHPRQVPKPHLRELILAEDDEQTSFATSAVTDYHELLPDRCHPGQRQKCLKKIKITLHVKSETRNYETPCLDFHNRSVSPSCTMGKYIQSSERASLLVFPSSSPVIFSVLPVLGRAGDRPAPAAGEGWQGASSQLRGA